MAIDPRFDTSDGGIGKYRALVVDAFFQEGDYGWALHLKNALAEPELHPDVKDGEWTERFNLGTKWTSPDGGVTATHPNGDRQTYNSAAQIGVLLNGQKGKARYDDEPYLGLVGLPGFLEAIPDTFSAYRADSFKGLDLEWDSVTYPFRRMGKKPVIAADGTPVMDISKNPPEPMTEDTGVWEEAERTMRMPVAFYGIGASSVPVQTASSNGASKSFDFLATIDDGLRAKLKVAAAGASNHDELLNAVIGIDGALQNQELATAVADKASFDALKAALVS